MNDDVFRAAVFERFMQGHDDSTAKEIAQVAKCHESHIYAYLRKNNNFAPDGINKRDSYRGVRRVAVFSISEPLFRKMLTKLLAQNGGAYNLFFAEFQESQCASTAT